MIYSAAVHISSVLNAPEVDTIMGTADAFFWELAEQDTVKPFGTFTISGAPVTKSGLKDYNATIRIFDDSLTAAAIKAEQLQEYIENSEVARWRNKGSASGYTSGEASTAFIEINYNLKL